MHTTPSKTARTNFMTRAFDCELPPDTLSKIDSGQIEPNIRFTIRLSMPRMRSMQSNVTFATM